MWLLVIAASFFEVAFTVCMKMSDGMKNKKFAVLAIITTLISVGLLSLATKTLPLGVAYAVWTGLGTIFNVVFGILMFKEPKDAKRLVFMGLILIGVVGLRLST